MDDSSIIFGSMPDHPPTTNHISDLLGRWPTRAALADQIGVKTATVHKWAQNRSIPSRYHPSILDAALGQGIALSADEIVAAHRDDRAGAVINA